MAGGPHRRRRSVDGFSAGPQPRMTFPSRRLEDLALLGTFVTGLLAFVFPLLASGRESDSPFPSALFVALVVAAVAVVLTLGLHTQRLSTRLLAVLAAMVAVNAALRIAVVIGIWGFSPIFFLLLAGGFALGPSFGFGLGALTLLLSAALSGGFGPWLPYQMLAAGWVGMGAGLLGRWFGGHASSTSLIVLALYGFLAGFGYGFLLDLWDWPLLLGAETTPISWAPHLGLPELAHRFGAFYLATSLAYDAFRAVGNLVLVALLGMPVISTLERFRLRFLVEWDPRVSERDPGPPVAPVGRIGVDKMLENAGARNSP